MKTTLLAKISVVVPVYNEAMVVRELHQKIVAAMNRQPDPYEIIFVNDGSTDETERVLDDLKPLRVVTLQKNYGQTAAIDIGIREAKGEIIVLLDADLQNDPEEILLLLEKVAQGNDVVVGWRKERHDPFARLLFSKIANAAARLFFGLRIHDFGCGLKAYRSRFIRNLSLRGETQVFLPAVAKGRGAVVCEVPVKHYPRGAGSSKISIGRMLRGSFGLLRAAFFIQYFTKPLRDPYLVQSIKNNE